MIWKVTYDGRERDWVKSSTLERVLPLVPDLDETAFDAVTITKVPYAEPISMVGYAPDDLMFDIKKLPDGVHIVELEGGGFGLTMTAEQWDASLGRDQVFCSSRWES